MIITVNIIIYDFSCFKAGRYVAKILRLRAAAKKDGSGRKRHDAVKVPTLMLATIFAASLHGERKHTRK